VPMGGVFTSKGKPVLVVSALKDEAPLGQVEIIKLSAEAGGKVLQRHKTVALSAAQESKACVVWSDGEYRPGQATLYYARVLEQPTWRWSHQDCAADPAANPEGCKSGGLDVKIQERAWTSPVFSRL
jgi:hypothetical protein